MNEVTLEKQIDDTERRLEMRRARVARHVQEARAETDSRLRTGLKWAPLIAVGAVGAMAFRAGLRRDPTVSPRVTPPPLNGASRPINVTAEKANGTRSLATLATVAGVVARAALSPQAQELWRLYLSRRGRSQRIHHP